MAWWANAQIAPVEIARDLWQTTLLNLDLSGVRTTVLQHGRAGARGGPGEGIIEAGEEGRVAKQP
jgi:hypothetical protein